MLSIERIPGQWRIVQKVVISGKGKFAVITNDVDTVDYVKVEDLWKYGLSWDDEVVV